MYKEMKRHFIKDEVRISSKCSNRPPALCTVREMHGKITVCYKTARLAKEKNDGCTRCSPACGDAEIHPFPRRMQKRCNFGK